jgi:hypothetical protein
VKVERAEWLMVAAVSRRPGYMLGWQSWEMALALLWVRAS